MVTIGNIKIAETLPARTIDLPWENPVSEIISITRQVDELSEYCSLRGADETTVLGSGVIRVGDDSIPWVKIAYCDACTTYIQLVVFSLVITEEIVLALQTANVI